MRPSTRAAWRTGRSSRRRLRSGSGPCARAPLPSRHAARPCIPTPNRGSRAKRLRRRSRAGACSRRCRPAGGLGRLGRRDRRPRPFGGGRPAPRRGWPVSAVTAAPGARPRLHPLGGDRPRLRLDVDLAPRRAARLAAPARGEHDVLERELRADPGIGRLRPRGRAGGLRRAAAPCGAASHCPRASCSRSASAPSSRPRWRCRRLDMSPLQRKRRRPRTTTPTAPCSCRRSSTPRQSWRWLRSTQNDAGVARLYRSVVGRDGACEPL